MDVTSSTVGRSDDVELTVQEAARFLGISLTYLDRLVEEGHVSAHLVGPELRFRASDMMTFRRAREKRLAQVAAISQADLELGVQY